MKKYGINNSPTLFPIDKEMHVSIFKVAKEIKSFMYFNWQTR